MLISDKILVKTNSKTLKYYQEKGYKCKTTNEEILINVYDLKKYSSVKIVIKCDYCDKLYQIAFSDWLRNNKQISKDACKECCSKKNKELCILKHGVENVFQLSDIKQKSKNTILEKYGVENPSQLKSVQDKIKQNNLKKYGVTNTSKLQSVKDKVKQSNLEKFGVDNAMKLDCIKEKARNTSLEKYGVEHPMKNEDVLKNLKKSFIDKYGVDNPMKVKHIRQKALQTKFDNNSNVCSKPQKILHEYIGGYLNYPCDLFSIDIALLDDNIAVEYNGGGHDLCVKLSNMSQSKFNQKETHRKKVLYKNGYRIITFITKTDKIFDKDKTNKLIEYCKDLFETHNKHWVEIWIDDEIIKTSTFETKIKNIISAGTTE